mgnify:CR=1 FL=1
MLEGDDGGLLGACSGDCWGERGWLIVLFFVEISGARKVPERGSFAKPGSKRTRGGG